MLLPKPILQPLEWKAKSQQKIQQYESKHCDELHVGPEQTVKYKKKISEGAKEITII